MALFESIYERRVREAAERGDFAKNPLKGRPLVLDDDAQVPEELPPAYRILKNAGYVPEELELRGRIRSLRDLLELCADAEQADELRDELRMLELRYEVLVERRFGRRPLLPEYRAQALRRL